MDRRPDRHPRLYAAGAVVLALQGKERVGEATPRVPEPTIETVKEDVQWALGVG
jgi:hypothetical protein